MSSNSATITVDSKILLNTIQVINHAAAPYSGSVNVVCKDGTFSIESRAELSTINTVVPTESIEGNAEFGVMLDTLQSACSGRAGIITITYENTVLSIKSKGYKIDLASVDYVAYSPVAKPNADSVKISVEQSNWLKSAISLVALTPNLTSPIMPVAVSIDSDGTTVACYARDHISFIKTAELVSDSKIEFAIPVESAVSLFNTFKDAEFTLIAEESYVHAENNICSLYISLPATDAYLPYDELQSRIDVFMSSEAPTITIPIAELNTLFGNCKALATKERGELIIKSNTKKTIISKTSANGTANALFTGCSEGSLEIKIDEQYFQEALSKVDKKSDAVIKCNADMGFIVVPGKNDCYSVIALNR